ncbi:uncharacterized protein LOC143211236 [Lasioglossum baleicum]|uniref:uncharacterized protein LOC143211217 n=1 Tax=Lasioglossum baleicum TaxID=434251 RepID=UPI003FCE637B
MKPQNKIAKRKQLSLEDLKTTKMHCNKATASTSKDPEAMDRSDRETLKEENRKLKEEIRNLKQLYEEAIVALKTPKTVGNTTATDELSPDNTPWTMEIDAESSQQPETGFAIVQHLRKKNLENRETLKRINQPKDPAKLQTKAQTALTSTTTSATNPSTSTKNATTASHAATSSETTTAVHNTKGRRPPPINILHQDPKDSIKLLQETGNPKFHIKRINNTKHIVQMEDISDFDKVKNILNSTNTEFYTYTPKWLKHQNFLVKGLPPSFENTEILTELEKTSNNKIKFIKVSNFTTPIAQRENRILPIFLVQIEAGSDLAELKNVRYIFHHSIKWEKLKKKGVMQCRRCQRFDHTAANCNLAYRCVKCDDDHAPGECKVTANPENPVDTKPYCVNCKTIGHPASYKGCPKLKEFLQQKLSSKTACQDRAPRKIINQALLQPGITYAMASAESRDRRTHSTQQQPTNKNEQSQFKPTQIDQLENRTGNLEKSISDINKKLELFSSQLNQLITIFLNGK